MRASLALLIVAAVSLAFGASYHEPHTDTETIQDLRNTISSMSSEISSLNEHALELSTQLSKHKEFLAVHLHGQKSKQYNTISANGKWPILVVYTLPSWPSSRLHGYFKTEGEAADFLTLNNAHMWEIRNVCAPLPACEQIALDVQYDYENQRRMFTSAGG